MVVTQSPPSKRQAAEEHSSLHIAFPKLAGQSLTLQPCQGLMMGLPAGTPRLSSTAVKLNEAMEAAVVVAVTVVVRSLSLTVFEPISQRGPEWDGGQVHFTACREMTVQLPPLRQRVVEQTEKSDESAAPGAIVIGLAVLVVVVGGAVEEVVVADMLVVGSRSTQKPLIHCPSPASLLHGVPSGRRGPE